MRLKTHGMTAFAIAAALALAADSGARAQGASLAAGQVPGAEVQAWLEADGFPVAGISLANGCYFITRGPGTARAQSVHCPAMAPFTLTGEAKVVGNQLCSKFTYPDGNVLDRCADIIKVGENKYELRAEGRVTHVLYRLVR